MSIKASIYDKLSRILTDYEHKKANENDLYNILVDIQNNWDFITCNED